MTLKVLKVLKVLKDNIEGVYLFSEASEGIIYTQLWYIYKGFKDFCSCLPCPLISLYPSEASEGSEASGISEISSAIKKEDELFK